MLFDVFMVVFFCKLKNINGLDLNSLLSAFSSSDKSVKVWDASSRACINTFFDHQDQVPVSVIVVKTR